MRRVGNELMVHVRVPIVERRVARVLCGGVCGYGLDRTPHGAEIHGYRIRRGMVPNLRLELGGTPEFETRGPSPTP